jgi:hypothetical protein
VPVSVSTTEWPTPAAAAGPAVATPIWLSKEHAVRINRENVFFIVIISSCGHTSGGASAFGHLNSNVGLWNRSDYGE